MLCIKYKLKEGAEAGEVIKIHFAPKKKAAGKPPLVVFCLTDSNGKKYFINEKWELRSQLKGRDWSDAHRMMHTVYDKVQANKKKKTVYSDKEDPVQKQLRLFFD